MKHFSAEIISNVALSACFHELTFAWTPDGSDVPLPGQFCTLRASPFSAPLLRRPFAFSAFDRARGSVSIVYKRRGPATELLAAVEKGDNLDVIGPLGNGFPAMSGFPFSNALCIAGGTGVGPMVFLATSIALQGGNARLVVGCKTKADLPRFSSLAPSRTIVTTDDASEGVGGTPLAYLAKLTKDEYGGAVVCACGPSPLMHGCRDWARLHGLRCFVSVEQIMACGVGACMGCVVKVTDGDASGFARACTEGPVFDSERILWT